MISTNSAGEVTQRLDNAIKNMWQDLFASEQAQSLLAQGAIADRRIYALYMTQVYHYAWHTPRNLALAGANLKNNDLRLMHHCFEHAMEETGHELMALHDLKQLGVSFSADDRMLPMLPATRAMIDYVREVAVGEHPFGILGYSYWIERPYEYILSFMQLLEKAMGLTREQMTFYYNHMEIDKKHGDDICDVVIKVSEQEGNVDIIETVARKTMNHLRDMLLEIIEEYRKLVSGESDAFVRLNTIVD